jgi:hypothetical protein
MPEFIRRANKVMAANDKRDFINYIAHNPKAGEIMISTGGVRKVRFARQGRGKSGSYRVLYYYHNQRNPLYLFTVFGKGEKANISDAGRNGLKTIIRFMKKELQP